MIDREKIIVIVPTLDGRPCIETMVSLVHTEPFYHTCISLAGISNISLARNKIAHRFLALSQYEWLMMVDSDMVFSVDDWHLLWEGDEDIVTAEYSKKILGEPPAQFGLGFTRVHRSVFEKIDALNTENGVEFAQRFYLEGEMYVNYFPNMASSESRWVSEDHGFFVLASLSDVRPRVEKRTKLRHVGKLEYGYPDQIPIAVLEKLLAKAKAREILEAGLHD